MSNTDADISSRKFVSSKLLIVDKKFQVNKLDKWILSGLILACILFLVRADKTLSWLTKVTSAVKIIKIFRVVNVRIEIKSL